MPTKRTPETRQRMVDLLAGGTTKTAACAAVRISRDTLNEWLNDDEEFRLDIEAAIQTAITRNVLLIQRAAQPRPVKKTRTEYAIKKNDDGKPGHSTKPVIVAKTVEEYEEEGDWRAAAWYNERMDPENFGKRLDVTTAGQPLPAATVLVGLDKVDDAEIERRIAEAEGGEAPPDLPASP